MNLVDAFNRKIENVRISIQDKCDLRCVYCMPENGVKWLDKKEQLTFSEIYKLIEVFNDLDVKKIKLTGGEPLLRKDVIELVKKITIDLPKIELSMTTNGVLLSKYGKQLFNAGLRRVNISLDTLNHDKFEEITRKNKLNQVLDGIKCAIEVGLEVKINAVSIKNFNDDKKSLNEFINFSEINNIPIRFIELMPFTGNKWNFDNYVSSEELRETIKSSNELIPLKIADKSSTSKYWRIEKNKATVGFISSVSESFCENCNRIRVTAEGKLRPCLHRHLEYDLRPYLNGQKRFENISKFIQMAINEKWKEHPDFLALRYKPPIDDREMIRIGG